MHKVQRAIIMAAGFGSRLQPLTSYTPKPLIKINGVRMIDSILTALHANGITEIYIVVGYLAEQFSCLEKEYPGVKLILNPDYANTNNISSLYAARNYLEDSIILDGDQLIKNKEVLTPYFEYSGYNAVWVEHNTKEWLLTLKDGIVTECSRTGGTHGWQLYSISRWSSEDACRLREHLIIEYEVRKNHQIYWDDIALFCYPKAYKLGIREMNKEDMVEVDSLSELIALDESYRKFLQEN